MENMEKLVQDIAVQTHQEGLRLRFESVDNYPCWRTKQQLTSAEKTAISIPILTSPDYICSAEEGEKISFPILKGTMKAPGTVDQWWLNHNSSVTDGHSSPSMWTAAVAQQGTWSAHLINRQRFNSLLWSIMKHIRRGFKLTPYSQLFFILALLCLQAPYWLLELHNIPISVRPPLLLLQ